MRPSAVRQAIRTSDEEHFPLEAIERALFGHGITMRFTDEELDALLETEYGRRSVFPLLAATYPGLSSQFRFHMDHVFPKAGFDRRKLRSAGFDEEAIDRMKALVNQTPNLQILEGLENEGKRDTPFEQWIAPMQQANSTAWADFRERHAIPEMASYGLAHFEAFFAERRALLRKRLAKALNLTTPAAVPEVEQA